jgi:phosphoserine aminotransferase
VTHRIHNFGAGPGALPLAVLEEAQRELVDFQGSGHSILETSHRGALYEAVHFRTIDTLRELLDPGRGLPDHEVLFLSGGARTQFAVVPLNLMPAGGTADYLVTGVWSEMAVKEAAKRGTAREAYSSAATRHDHVPAAGGYSLDAGAAYLHYTSNNTIYGTQFDHVPDSGDVPLVGDLSSDILSRPLDAARFGLIYAGAQKNIGAAGVTLVVVRKDLLARSSKDLPDTLNYAKVAAEKSLLNTPPVFAIYLVGLVARHLSEHGGAAGAEARNEEKAALLYGAIDRSGGFYQGHARPDSRSRMNVTFRLGSDELTAAFLGEAKAAAMEGLKGHRSVGGLRASIYNAVEISSVRALVELMDDFARRHG